jgi:hypothetical protein
MIIASYVPFVGLAVAIFAGQKVAKSEATFSSAGFIAGVALLPLGLISLVVLLVGMGNIEVSAILSIVGVCLTILIVFAGLTRIALLSDKAASYAVPLVIIASVWISKIIFTSIFIG